MSALLLKNQQKQDITAKDLIRIQPHNELAEQMILGAMLVNNDHYNKVSDFLYPEHFFIPLHQKIYESISIILERGIVASPVTLKNYFENDNNSKDYNSSDYLGKIATYGTSIINVIDYAKTIADLALKRKLIEIGENVVITAFEHDINSTATHQLEAAEQELFNLANYGKEGRGGFLHLKDNLINSLNKIQSAFKHKESVTGISSGYTDLDSLLGGFQDSDLVILAGRPSMGKTAIVVNLALNGCKYMQKKFQEDKKKSPEQTQMSVGVFSLEMSGDQIATRLISMLSGISSSKLRSGHIQEEDFAKVVSANKDLYNLPFFIDDTPALSISALRTRARRLKRRHNLGLLIIDYLQLVKGSSKSSEGNRVQEVSEITQGLKAIAKELNIPVIALSQLSRAVEQREDKRPLLSDLRESGSIEQDADIVMFIYREDYYLIRKQPKENTSDHEKWQSEMDKVMNVTELIIAKQRNGPIGSVKLYFDSKTTSFTNFTEEHNYVS